MTRKAKITKRIFSALWWLAVILLAILLINIIGAKLRGEVPSVFGYSVMQIVTGSMEDTIETGTYILVRETDPEDIKREDIISFYSEENLIYGMPNTHRVKDIIRTENGLEFVTRGDANPANDEINAKEDRLIGVYVTSLDILGDFSSFLSNGGMLAIMAVLWVSLFGMIGFMMYKKMSAHSTENEEKDGGEGEK